MIPDDLPRWRKTTREALVAARLALDAATRSAWRQAIDRHIERAFPGLATAHASLGNLLNADWRWGEAAAEFRRAISLDSQLPSAQQWLGENLLVNGRVDEALIHLENATMADPMSLFFTTSRKGTPHRMPMIASFTNGWAKKRWSRGSDSRQSPIMMMPEAIATWVGWKGIGPRSSRCVSLPWARRRTSSWATR